MTISLQLPKSIPPKFKELSINFKTKTDGGWITTQILPASNNKNDEAIILDFDYAKSEDLTIDKLNEYLDESHAHTKKIFNEVITKEYLQVMRGEVI